MHSSPIIEDLRIEPLSPDEHTRVVADVFMIGGYTTHFDIRESTFFQQGSGMPSNHRLMPEELLPRNIWVNDIDAAIESLLDDHSNPDWDGEGADGLRSETVSVARAVAKGLPYISGPDDVCATPKGEVDISWFLTEGSIGLSIGPMGRDLVLTALLEGGREYSMCEPWQGSVPQTMKCCLSELLK